MCLRLRTHPVSDCEEWSRARDKDGYGVRRVGTRTVKAHRHAYEQKHGPIPDGMLVMHTCDNPPCVNLDHLRLGTVADNNRDMARKGRHRHNQRTHFGCGHAITPENTAVRNRARGWRECRACKRARRPNAAIARHVSAPANARKDEPR